MSTMICSSCNISGKKVIEVFLKSWSDINDFDRPGPSWVCAKCLVGWNVPVFRPKREKWEFGTVEAYIEETCEHSLCFMDDEKDWAVVESLPFKKYIDHCKLASLRNHPRGDLHMRLDSESGKMVNKSAPFEFEGTVKTFHHPSSRVANISFQGTPVRGRASIELSISHLTLGTPDNNKRNADEPATPTSLENSDSPRYNQRLWTPEEDKMLQETIASNKYQLRWPLIAKAVPGRSGKQCRERYLNHLKSTLKLIPWSASEDALIFRLYHVQGSKWAMMSRLLRGRTDNSIKNRYHHMKRKFEKRIQSLDSMAEVEELATTLIKESQQLLVKNADPLLLKFVAAHISGATKSTIESEHTFGPLRVCKPAGGESCSRCGLMMPSLQTGRLVCSKTGWCESCTRVSPCVNGDALRMVHKGGELKKPSIDTMAEEHQVPQGN